MLTGGVICSLYKVVTRQCLGVTLVHRQHKVEVNEGLLLVTHIHTSLVLLLSYCY